MEKGVFPPPSLEGYTKSNEWDHDVDKDGIKESHIIKYTNSAGDTILKTSTRGTDWLWLKKTQDYNSNQPDITKGYVIRDSNCDGKFDEKYSLSESFDLPACLK
ncbi:MAG: hypothetical protein FJ139_06590 [Deltaproteobacteria bacterium]|nr:hypothetical protein [Deltaproteobacteria bacterium]